MVAKEERDGTLPRSKAMRPVKLVSSGHGPVTLTMEPQLERASKHALVRRRPEETLFGGKPQDFVRNTPLARPQSVRPGAENTFVESDRGP